MTEAESSKLCSINHVPFSHIGLATMITVSATVSYLRINKSWFLYKFKPCIAETLEIEQCFRDTYCDISFSCTTLTVPAVYVYKDMTDVKYPKLCFMVDQKK